MSRIAVVICNKRHILAECTTLSTGDVLSWNHAKATFAGAGEDRWITSGDASTKVTRPASDFEVGGEWHRTGFTLQCKVCKQSYSVDLGEALEIARSTKKPVTVRAFGKSYIPRRVVE